MFLPANRELAHLERLFAEVDAAERVEGILRLEAARRFFRESLVELQTLAIDPAAIDEWSRRTFRGISHAFFDIFSLITKGTLPIEQLRADLESQRLELQRFLAPLRVDSQADWAMVTLQLSLEALTPHLRAAQVPTREVLEQQLAEVDFAGPIGSSLRIMCFLTVSLEAARAGLPADERAASFASLAFMDALVLARGLQQDMGLSLDPTPYLLRPRGAVARDALLRLLALPADDELNLAIQKLVG